MSDGRLIFKREPTGPLQTCGDLNLPAPPNNYTAPRWIKTTKGIRLVQSPIAKAKRLERNLKAGRPWNEGIAKSKLPTIKPAKDRTRLLVAAVTPDEAEWIHKFLCFAPETHVPRSITDALTPLMQGLARQWLMGQ